MQPTATPITPTATPITPTATPITPTATPITPTATPITPTATPITPTATPITPTATPITPTATPITPTATPITPTVEQTGDITILKRFCEADNSANANSNCNGRVAPGDVDVVFEVRVGADATDGPVDDSIVVAEFNQGNGSQGQETATGFAAGETFTVCEIPVQGFLAVARPGAQGGANQTGIEGEPCIQVVLVPGNNVLQFNNFLQDIVTPTATPVTPTATPVTPTATPVTPTATPVTPTATPVTPTHTPVTPTVTPSTVNVLPSTGSSDNGAGSGTAGLLALVAGTSLLLAGAALAGQRAKAHKG